MWILKAAFSFSLLSPLPLCPSSSSLSFGLKHWIHSYIKGKSKESEPTSTENKGTVYKAETCWETSSWVLQGSPADCHLGGTSNVLTCSIQSNISFQSLLTECIICISVILRSLRADQCPIISTFPLCSADITEFYRTGSRPAVWAQRSTGANTSKI